MDTQKEEFFSFTNVLVDDSTLPNLATLEYSPLEKSLQKSDMIITAVIFMIPFIALFILRYIAEFEFIVAYGHFFFIGVFVLFMLSMLYSFYAYYQKSYALREKDIAFNQGLFWKSSTVVPFNRVQHCEVSQGPIDRFFGLSSLKIFTAGGSSSDLTIEGLNPERAHRIKDFIVNKTGLNDEEE